MACQTAFRWFRKWAKRIIFTYILFALLFTCPLVTDGSEKDVDYYICKTGDGIHDLMLDSPLYPVWTKVVDPSVEVLRKKAYPIMKKVSKRFGKKIKPYFEKTSAEGQVYLQAVHEKVLELHELHLAPTVQKIQLETEKLYKQYKPTVDKHASNIHSVYTENVKPHLVKHSSTLCELIKTNTPKPVYEKFEYMDYFIKNELKLGTSTIPSKIHGFFKYQFLPVLYLKVNNVVGEIKNFYEPHEKNFHSSSAGTFYREKATAFNSMRSDPESLYHKLTTKLFDLYDSASTILNDKVDEFLSDPADLEAEEKVASAFFHESREIPSKKIGKEFNEKTGSVKKSAESVASAASETLESATESVLPKVTSSAKKAAAEVTDGLSEGAESAASVASETLESATDSVLPKVTSSAKKAAGKAKAALSEGAESAAKATDALSEGAKSAAKASDALSESAKSAASVAAETLASVNSKVLPKETPDIKNAAFQAASDVSENAKSAASAASESLESVAGSVLTKVTPGVKEAAAEAKDGLSDSAESAASVASETLASVTSKVLPNETPDLKNSASKAASGLSEGAKSAASAASESLESVTSSVLPNETSDLKKAAGKAADVLSESAESLASKLKPGSKADRIPADKEPDSGAQSKKNKSASKAGPAQEKSKTAAKKDSKKASNNRSANDAKPDVVEQSVEEKGEGVKAKKPGKATVSEESVQEDSIKDEL